MYSEIDSISDAMDVVSHITRGEYPEFGTGLELYLVENRDGNIVYASTFRGDAHQEADEDEGDTVRRIVVPIFGGKTK